MIHKAEIHKTGIYRAGILRAATHTVRVNSVKVKKLVRRVRLCNPTDCSPAGSSVHGILQARILEWTAIPFSRGYSRPRDRSWVSRIEGRVFTICRSVAQLCPTLCDPMNCGTPGFRVPHHLPELAQTHDHRVGDAIQPSHPLSSPSPTALNLSQHQSLFQAVRFWHQALPSEPLQTVEDRGEACGSQDSVLFPRAFCSLMSPLTSVLPRSGRLNFVTGKHGPFAEVTPRLKASR